MVERHRRSQSTNNDHYGDAVRRDHRHVADWDGAGTGFTITGAVAFVDTLTLLGTSPLLRADVAWLRKRYGRRLILEECPVPRRPHSRLFWTTIHQPDQETLERLFEIQHKRFVVHAVHLAVDFLCSASDAERLIEFLKRGLVQKWGRRDSRFQAVATTHYWHHARRAPRNLTLYSDRPSKTGLGPCAHLELRFTGAAACKRAGVENLKTLMRGVDMVKMLQHQTRIAFIDENKLDRIVAGIAKRELRAGLHSRHTTIDQIKKLKKQMLARAVQDEDLVPNPHMIAKARSQNLVNHQRMPSLRRCLKQYQWSDLTPPPHWHCW